jgi:hypothetical protein
MVHCAAVKVRHHRGDPALQIFRLEHGADHEQLVPLCEEAVGCVRHDSVDSIIVHSVLQEHTAHEWGLQDNDGNLALDVNARCKVRIAMFEGGYLLQKVVVLEDTSRLKDAG